MRKIVRILGYLILLSILSGCGLTKNQIVQIHAFGAATKSVGDLGENEFINIRNGVIEMRHERALIDDTKTANELIDFDKTVTVENTAVRVSASKALRLYGELLVKLVTEDRSENLQKVANSLIDNTAAALKEDISDEKKDAINKIIVGLGSFWVESKKADAVKGIILEYQQPVKDLAKLLNDDFSLNEDGFLLSYDDEAGHLRNQAIKIVDSGNEYGRSEREQGVRALSMADKAKSRAKGIDEHANTVIDNLIKAHEELVDIMQNKKHRTQDIKAYVKQIQNLVNLSQVLAN